jgi:hypothetical protein
LASKIARRGWRDSKSRNRDSRLCICAISAFGPEQNHAASQHKLRNQPYGDTMFSLIYLLLNRKQFAAAQR